ncbi:MAG: threonylcarbamoyl-AMP synthase [Actinomycetia bacterium]|nr:threonylcarbamoyl-AMP synthase [Actinomycetes bacterium]
MTTFDYVEPSSPTGTLKLGEITRISDELRSGGLAILPTETGYMLAADATNDGAVRMAFRVKRRPLAATMHVACSSLEMIAKHAEINTPARRILSGLTPGPISVVVSVAEQGTELSGRVLLDGTVGIRVPDHPATLQVIEALGRPVTATSLNESSGSATALDEPSLRTLDWPPLAVVHVVDAGQSIPYSMASTLVRVTGPEFEILRDGPIVSATIARTVRQVGPLEPAE